MGYETRASGLGGEINQTPPQPTIQSGGTPTVFNNLGAQVTLPNTVIPGQENTQNASQTESPALDRVPDGVGKVGGTDFNALLNFATEQGIDPSGLTVRQIIAQLKDTVPASVLNQALPKEVTDVLTIGAINLALSDAGKLEGAGLSLNVKYLPNGTATVDVLYKDGSLVGSVTVEQEIAKELVASGRIGSDGSYTLGLELNTSIGPGVNVGASISTTNRLMALEATLGIGVGDNCAVEVNGYTRPDDYGFGVYLKSTF